MTTSTDDSGAPVAVWFRRDLRIDDHAALRVAAARSSAGGDRPVLCVYCLDPRELGATPLIGAPRTGPWRARFLREALADLRATLRAIGGELVVRRGRPEDVLPTLARELGLTRIHAHRLVGTEEQDIEQAVAAGLANVACALRLHWDRTLFELADLPFQVAELPGVFTAFRQRVERARCFAAPVDPVEQLRGLVPDVASGGVGELPELSDFELREPVADERAAFTFVGGETAARERLAQWAFERDCLRDYKATRNGLHGADFSSRLAPWLALGCISPRRVQSEVERYERERVKNDSTYWLTFELLWRDFFQLVLQKHGARLFWPSGLQGRPVPWRHDDAAFEAWRTGRTGIPLVDALMRELLATGFVSNRGRQIVGSFLTKHLGIDWRWGAEWFESQLVDYDVASNWGNWSYVAGVGNDARGFRWFNIETQAKKYDKAGDYVKRWCPELALLGRDTVHAPWTVPPLERRMLGVDYDEPIVDLEAGIERTRQEWEAAAGGEPRGSG